MSDGRKFERFGKYLILDHLVDGGMAKICRARFLGEQANKIVAIKMVQPQFSKDEAFVQMFEDELKVTFGLLHPNIAQMYDYGIVNGQLYTAMEYVDGANLKQYLDRLRSKNFVFPVEISTYIISQVCQALHYAHTFQDKMTGKKLNIIHRDISPHNIMLTFDGAIKVIDFGIAKADSNSEATQAGTIKGKLSYLAPEYLDGLDLDPRYDEFAVGITLWEMLCSRKLFSASNDLAVLKQIQACKVPPPSSINPNVPKELDAIVLKALAKDRNNRYEDMDQFNRALIKFLYSHYPEFNNTDLGYFSKQLFKEEIELERKKFFEYGKIDILPYIDDMKKERNYQKGSSATDTRSTGTSQGERTQRIELNLGPKIDVAGIALEDKSETKKRITTAQLKKNKNTNTMRGERTSTRRMNKNRTRSKSTQVKTAPKSNVYVGLFKMAMGIVLVAGLTIFNADLVKKFTGFDVLTIVGQKARDVASVEKNKNFDRDNSDIEPQIRKNSLQGQLTLLGYETSMNVFINDKLVKVSGIDAPIPLSVESVVRIEKKGYVPFVHSGVYVTADKPNYALKIPDFKVERVGLLSTSKNYTPGSRLIFDIEGRTFDKELPLENIRVPAGEYEGVIRNPVLNTEKKIQFVIKENKRVFLE